MPKAVTFLQNVKKAATLAASASIQLVFPAVCRICDEPVAEGEDFCPGCSTALAVSESAMKSACLRCGVPAPNRFSASADAKSLDSLGNEPDHHREPTVLPATEIPFPQPSKKNVQSCLHCHDLQFEFEQVVACWSYHGAVCDAIVAAKYVHQAPLGDALGRRLGGLAAERLCDDPPDVVTFVPSHVSRQLTRGGNGMESIAEAATRRLSLFFPRIKCRQLLRTTRRIKKQAWLDDRQRQENVSGAFAIRKTSAPTGLPSFHNRHILLIDDVLTTGATASEVSRVLCQAGAKRVTLAVLARAIRTN